MNCEISHKGLIACLIYYEETSSHFITSIDCIVSHKSRSRNQSGNRGRNQEGFFTNDEGRLGDDEKEESSFECDVRINPWWEERSASDTEEDKFQNMVNGVMDEYRRPFVSGVEGKGGLGRYTV